MCLTSWKTSIGVDRMFLQVMSAAYTEEKLENGEERVVLRIPAALAPTKVAVLPLVKKDGMPEVAQRIVDLLKYDFNVVYDEKDSVGKRYRRQDAIGTPLCVTVDGQTLGVDNTVTVRHRDTMQQERGDRCPLRTGRCGVFAAQPPQEIECLTGLSRVSRRVRRTASTVCFVSGMFV